MRCGAMSMPAAATVRVPHDRCSLKDMNMMAKTMAILVAACVLGGASSAMAAPLKHRSSAHWAPGQHTSARTHARAHAFEPRYNPYAYGAYGFQPYSSAQERWFDQAKGNIW
jgi:hypothetical protein